MKTGNWVERITLRVARLLARETAPTWIMVGTLSIAGLGATALGTSAVAHSLPAQTTSNSAALQPSPYPYYGYCHFGYDGNSTTTCGRHFGYGWHHRHWAEYLWHHYGQTGQQGQIQPAGGYVGMHGYGYTGVYGYGYAGMHGYAHAAYMWGNDTWTPEASTPSAVTP